MNQLIIDTQKLCEKIIRDKIPLNVQDITNLILNDSFVFKNVLTVSDFKEIAYSFDLNRDGVVDIYDFQYLMDNITDLSIINNISKVGLIIANKGALIKNIKLTPEIAKDVIVRVILYSILVTVVNNREQYISWAVTVRSDNKNNLSFLFTHLNELIVFINNSQFIMKEFENVSKVLKPYISSFFDKLCGKYKLSLDTSLQMISVLYKDAVLRLEKKVDGFDKVPL